MATTSPAFLRVWRHDGLRAVLLSHMDTETICALRLTASECCELTTPTLFTRTRLTFTPSALSRPSRLEALSRIGHHIEHLTFYMPHSSATFLPPLINPESGREVNFLYTPHTSAASVSQRPKYGCSELGDLLTQQYPPLFHAATNVPAFINAFSHLPNLRHLTIACPGQDPAQRYRRDCIDYALISLRIAIERAPLHRLEKLSLSHLHPSALLYLRHMPGFGCTPSAGRRWKQIRKLNITMDSWDFLGSQPGLDHLKILDDYIRSFSSSLEKVSFGWNGRKGPCPFTLFSDPLFAPPRKMAKLFNEVTSPMSPLPAAPSRPSMVFPKLRYMQVRNATMSSEQVADFILEHRHTVREFDFENVYLINGGTWEDALSPLTGSSESEEWLSQQSGSEAESALSFSASDLDQIDELDEVSEVIDTVLDPNASFEGLPPQDLTETTQVKKRRVRRKRRRKTSHKHPREKPEEPSFKTTASGSKLVISAPIPIDGPIEEVLMPKTFQPSTIPAVHLMPTTFNPNIQGVQRNVLMEAAQQELADDPEKRVSTLKKAKEAVLRQLGKEFCREKKEGRSGFFKHSCASGWKSRPFLGQESSTALVPLMFSRY